MGAPVLNPPLHIGQVLEPRKGSPLPKARISDFTIHGSIMEWLVTFADDGSSQFLTLKQIYRYYQFDDPL